MRRAAAGALLAACLSASARAQTTPPDGALTLAAAERLAVEASPALKAAAARVRQAEGHLRQAGLYPNPDLSLETNWFTQDWAPRETLLGLKQPIPYHNKRGLEQQMATERIAAAQADAQRERLDLVQKVRESFYRIGFTGKILALDRENLEAAQVVHKAVQERVAEGDAAPFEALKTSVEVSRAASEVRQLDGELQAETAVFNLLLGFPPGAPTVVGDPIAAAGGEGAIQDLEGDLPQQLRRALADQPEIKASEHAALAAGFQADRARLEHRPDVAIGPTFGVDQGDTLIGLGLSLRIPIWNRSQGLIEASDAARDEAQASVEAARLSVSSLLADAYGRFRSANALQRLYEEGLLTQADQLVDLTRKSYEGGAAGVLDLLDARRTAIAVKEEYYRACLDAAVAKTRLQRAVGAESAAGVDKETPQ